MSVSKELSKVDPFFLQACPLCGQLNQMCVRGVYRNQDKSELYPDMGYSFCTCKCIFYTKHENITESSPNEFQHLKDQMLYLRNKFSEMKSGDQWFLWMPDPFFVEWSKSPYEFLHWNPRRNHIIWDLNSFNEEVKNIGFDVVYATRQMDVYAQHPQTMEFLLKKP